ncbi:Transcription factor HBP-1b(c1)-like protein [Drosera capensis]
MQSFKQVASDMYCHSPAFYLRGDDGSRNSSSRYMDIGELEHPDVFHHHDAVDLSRSGMYNIKSNNVTVASSLHFGAINGGIGGGTHMGSSPSTVGMVVDAGELLIDKRVAAPVAAPVVAVSGSGHFDNWGESAMADTSQQTDTSTDVDTDEKNQYQGVNRGAVIVDSVDQPKDKIGDQKVLRRLAQNREAARKSRLRKKLMVDMMCSCRWLLLFFLRRYHGQFILFILDAQAYVQQLESSRIKLAQLEQELERARQQHHIIFIHYHVNVGTVAGGALAFDVNYSRWLDDHQRLINDLRSAINSQVPDEELRVHVDSVMSHHDELYRLKSVAAKGDIFHMLTGTWKTPVERFFMWLGGFRSSEVLKILVNHLEPLTDQQLVGICNLQQSSQQAEDALSQGMEALQLSLVDTLSSNCLGPSGSSNVADYMGQMAIAMGKLATLENFVHQADLLRQQTLQRMNRILTTRQAARALLVIHDYKTRLRALSSLWLARPKNS